MIGYLEIVPWVITGAGAVGVLVTSVVSPLPRTLKVITGALSGGVASLCLGVVIGKDIGGKDVKDLEHRVYQLTAQNAALRHAYQKQSTDLLERSQVNQSLRETVMTYRRELENGEVSECVADPVYDQRVRSILDTLPSD